MDHRKKLEQIASLLKSESTLVLSTADASGEPSATPLFFLADDFSANDGFDGLRVYWFSSASSAHSKNLKRDPKASVAIFHPTEVWKQIRGVQMRGTVATVKDRPLRKEVAAAYAGRFRLSAVLRAALSRSSLYVFHPAWVRYIDNGPRFGYKFEISAATFATRSRGGIGLASTSK